MDDSNFYKENQVTEISTLKRYFESFPLDTLNFLGKEKYHIFRVHKSSATAEHQNPLLFKIDDSADTILISTCLLEVELENALCTIMNKSAQLEILDFNPIELYHNRLTSGRDIPEEELYIREQGWLKKILIKEINWIKVEGVYTHLACQKGLHTLRNTASCIFNKLPKGLFFQIHKSYYVNRTKVEAINSTSLKIGEKILPIGRTFHKLIMKEIAHKY